MSLKLYLDIDETTAWAREIAAIARDHSALRDGSVRVFVMPSVPALVPVKAAFEGTPVLLGAQDLHWEDRGAFTGAISGADLKAMGCTLVEIGHAERRSHFGETDDVVRRKVVAAVRNGLTPVICVGEEGEGDTAAAIRETLEQLRSSIEGIGDAGSAGIVVAYEPVWAIGRATPAPAAHVVAVIAALRAGLAEDGRVSSYSVLYGGSAQRGTLSELRDGVDGLFLGRFAHDAANFGRILDEASALR